MLTDEQKAAGWIEHDGGPCPVLLDSRVQEDDDAWCVVKYEDIAIPSARITGDKDRENPVEGAPLSTVAADRVRLWFFRECNSGTRRQLFSIFGLPIDEIGNKGAERLCFNHILAALGAKP